MAAERLPDTSEEWVSLSVAIRETGVTRPTLIRWIRAKEIRGRRNATNEWEVWLPDAVARFNGDPVNELDSEEEVKPGTIHAQLIAALKASQRHVESLHEPARKYFELLAHENERLRVRVGQLEDRLSKTVDKWEAAMSLEHERRMAEREAERQAKRVDDALQTVSDYAPAILTAIAGHFGAAGAQEAILRKTIGDLSDEQIGKLVASGALGPKELAILDRLRASMKKDKQDGKAAA